MILDTSKFFIFLQVSKLCAGCGSWHRVLRHDIRQRNKCQTTPGNTCGLLFNGVSRGSMLLAIPGRRLWPKTLPRHIHIGTWEFKTVVMEQDPHKGFRSKFVRGGSVKSVSLSLPCLGEKVRRGARESTSLMPITTVMLKTRNWMTKVECTYNSRTIVFCIVDYLVFLIISVVNK